jgi:hypothetical protein
MLFKGIKSIFGTNNTIFQEKIINYFANVTSNNLGTLVHYLFFVATSKTLQKLPPPIFSISVSVKSAFNISATTV